MDPQKMVDKKERSGEVQEAKGEEEERGLEGGDGEMKLVLATKANRQRAIRGRQGQRDFEL